MGEVRARRRLRIRSGSHVFYWNLASWKDWRRGKSDTCLAAAALPNALWVFRTDPPATDLDADAETAYVAYDDGEIVALDLSDGAVQRRWHLTVASLPAVPTSLPVTAPGRLLIGTSDGRILDCSTR